ncbi:MAG TPA: hypothetical protein VNN73_17815 [Blastocatellia bacterium]|nr:hypothetical protein [Blastocatellia bacterium]
MPHKRDNQPPTGEGKKQNPVKGKSRELLKRSEVTQASTPRQNILGDEEEMAFRSNPSQRKDNPNRPKAGR